MGVAEVAGDRDNPTILGWARDLDIQYSGDDVPWCGLFVAHCVAATLPREPLPDNPLGARNWRKLGTKTEPMLGAVLVFWRLRRDGPFGHVGFYDSEDADTYHVLGGNQSNKVSVARIAKTRLITARWPSTAATLSSAAVSRAGSGPVLDNEA